MTKTTVGSQFDPCYTVSAPCGSGKSHAACQYIAGQVGRRIAGQVGRSIPASNFLYVAPTLALLQEVQDRLGALGVNAELITHAQYSGGVARSLVRGIKSTPAKAGKVLLVTHKAYLELPYFDRRDNWQVFIDEVPQVDEFRELQLPRTGQLLVEHLTPDQTFDNPYLVRLLPRDEGKLKRYLESPKDDGEEVLRSVLRDAYLPNKDLFTTRRSWDLLTGQVTCGKVHLLSMLNGRSFEGVTLLGAGLEQSLLVQHLDRLGVSFQPHKRIQNQLRYTTYSPALASRLSIEYLMADKRYSKTARNKTGDSGLSLGEEMDEVLSAHLQGATFALVANKDYRGSLLDQPGCVLMPVIPHGLNRYSDHTTVVFMAALNRKPEASRMLAALGLDAAQVQRATSHEVLHQCVMRSNLREPNSVEKVNVIVPDQWSANFLGQLFKGATVRQIGNLAPLKAPPLTVQQRKQRCWAKKSTSLLLPNQEKERNLISSMGKRSDSRQAQAPEEPANPLIVLTLQQHRWAKEEAEFQIHHFSVLDLVKQLKGLSKLIVDSKDQAVLFQLTEFDPSRDPAGYRRKANFKAAYGLILDFDDGNMSPEEFEGLFGSKAPPEQRCSFIICNSFSRSPAQPNKFRVIMPFQEPAETLHAFQAVYDGFAARIAAAGFDPKEAKLDRDACRTGVQAFYIPCTNRMHPGSAFFRKHGLSRMRDFQKYGLRPSDFIPAPAPIIVQQATATHQKPAADLGALASSLKAKIAAMSDGRNKPFFDAGYELWRAGMSLEDVEIWLSTTAGTEAKMQKRIPAIMKSLETYEERQCTRKKDQAPMTLPASTNMNSTSDAVTHHTARSSSSNLNGGT